MADDLIYHYTSAAGLKGIIESKSIHCTNSLFLNDSKEYYFILELVQKTLRQISNQNSAPLHVQQSIGRMLQNAHFFMNAPYRGDWAPCIASFSEKGDQLSQWRGYCPSGGYSLGFSNKELGSLMTSEKLQRLRKVEYLSEEDTSTSLTKLLEEFYNAMAQTLPIETETSSFLASVVPAELLPPPSIKETEINLYQHLMNVIYSMMPFYKHQSFQEEKEYRLALLALSTRRLEFKIRADIISPYVNFSLSSPEGSPLIALKRVYISPCDHPEQAKLGLRLFLNSQNLTHVEIEHSKIPYRNMG